MQTSVTFKIIIHLTTKESHMTIPPLNFRSLDLEPKDFTPTPLPKPADVAPTPSSSPTPPLQLQWITKADKIEEWREQADGLSRSLSSSELKRCLESPRYSPRYSPRPTPLSARTIRPRSISEFNKVGKGASS